MRPYLKDYFWDLKNVVKRFFQLHLSQFFQLWFLNTSVSHINVSPRLEIPIRIISTPIEVELVTGYIYYHIVSCIMRTEIANFDVNTQILMFPIKLITIAF